MKQLPSTRSTPPLPPQPPRHARGSALLILVALLLMGSVAYFLSNVSFGRVDTAQTRVTQDALVQAREALMGYVLRFRDDQASIGKPDRMYGFLPLPDLGSERNGNIDCLIPGSTKHREGCDASFFDGLTFVGNPIGPTVVGRFPWRTLGVPPLRDANGECLWMMVSALHRRIQGPNPLPMNFDTLGQLDVVVADGTAGLNTILDNAHQRPVAVIFSPGPQLPGQDRSATTEHDVSECGGNYDAKNYLDPDVAAALANTSNYLDGTNHATGTTGDSDTGNDPDTPKQLLLRGRIFDSAGNFSPTCTSGNCGLLANDSGIQVTPEHLFSAIRKHEYFRTDINSMLDRMVGCMRDKGTKARSDSFSSPPDKNAGLVEDEDNSCYDDDQHPLGYFSNYKDLVFVARPDAGAFTVQSPVGVTENCAGVVIFANQRDALPDPPHRATAQLRITAAQNNDPVNFLEANNYANFVGSGSVFQGEDLFKRAVPSLSGQAVGQDIARCIPATPSFIPVFSPSLGDAGFEQIVLYDRNNRVLELGHHDVTTTDGAAATDLFGCAWTPETRPLEAALRSYFTLQFFAVEGSVGRNGFVFALADGARNSGEVCGAAGSHLGYSGDNGETPPILPPKIGIEFDQSLNSGTTGEEPNPGRNDPDGGPGYNSHAAVVFWGAGDPLKDRTVLQDEDRPVEDDNVHGAPSPASTVGALRPPPRSHANPNTESGIKFLNLRGVSGGDSLLYHVRVEITDLPPLSRLLPVRAVAGSNIRLDLPGHEIDGISLISGNRVLLIAQTNRAENGVYVWTAFDKPLARTLDADEIPELNRAAVRVVRGSLDFGEWRQTAFVSTVDSDAQNWQPAVRWLRVEVWAQPDADPPTPRIRALANTTRPMSLLNAGFEPRLRHGDALEPATMYALSTTQTCGGSKQCTVPANCILAPDNRNCRPAEHETCGADHLCQRPALETVRLGFTNSQRTTAQDVHISNFFTTYVPFPP